MLDDIRSAREHDELTGGFKAVADEIERITGKYGLESFGEKGDAFDPHIHEALLHAHADGDRRPDLRGDPAAGLPDRRPGPAAGPGRRGRAASPTPRRPSRPDADGRRTCDRACRRADRVRPTAG